MAEARVPCPLCGGPVHPVAGRCKHCKADLAGLRDNRPQAAPTLPALQPGPTAPQAAPPRAAPIVPAPSPRAPAPPPLAPMWPRLVIALSVIAIVIAIIALAWSRAQARGAAGSGTEPRRGPDDRARRPPPSPPPPPEDVVRPPEAGDLADYVAHLPGQAPLRARIDTRYGAIDCELFEDLAPMTVANFVGLATGKKPWLDRDGTIRKRRPFYDGLTFHRVVEGFMIQGGDPNGTGRGGPGYQFADEIVAGVEMASGTLAMANAGPDTNGSQFFILDKPASWLQGKHTIFGRCEDLDVVRRISRAPTVGSDQPLDPITMTVTISR